MKKLSLITVLDVVGYENEEPITAEEPLFMQMVEGYPSMDDVFEFDEVIEIVEGKNKGAEIQIIIDYMEYAHGEEDPNETEHHKVELLDKLFDDLDYYLDNDILTIEETDDCIITVEDPNMESHEIVEADILDN